MVCPKWDVGIKFRYCWNDQGAKVSKYYFGSNDILYFANIPKFLIVRECVIIFLSQACLLIMPKYKLSHQEFYYTEPRRERQILCLLMVHPKLGIEQN
jgi:hypothetical protein